MSELDGDSILTGSMKRLDGSDQDLSEFEGDVVLVVNTASKCGLTPQYEGLQRLYDEKNEAGFTVLGFPANDFFEQEPGGEDEIAEFCQVNYGVSFPMFAKTSVKGDDANPLFATESWSRSSRRRPCPRTPKSSPRSTRRSSHFLVICDPPVIASLPSGKRTQALLVPS